MSAIPTTIMPPLRQDSGEEYALVPTKATQEMLDAGHKTSRLYGNLAEIFEAMLAAAPVVNADPDKQRETVTCTMRIPREKAAKISHFMGADTFERADAARNADREQCAKSVIECVKLVRSHRANSTFGLARILANLYNGDRVKADLTDLCHLDEEYLQHAMNAIRLRVEFMREPHTVIQDGGRIFEEMIESYRLEKKPRRRRS